MADGPVLVVDDDAVSRHVLCQALAAAEAGLDTLLLYTNSLMKENIALYQRLGYRIEREQPFGTSVQVYMSKKSQPA